MGISCTGGKRGGDGVRLGVVSEFVEDDANRGRKAVGGWVGDAVSEKNIEKSSRMCQVGIGGIGGERGGGKMGEGKCDGGKGVASRLQTRGCKGEEG